MSFSFMCTSIQTPPSIQQVALGRRWSDQGITSTRAHAISEHGARMQALPPRQHCQARRTITQIPQITGMWGNEGGRGAGGTRLVLPRRQQAPRGSRRASVVRLDQLENLAAPFSAVELSRGRGSHCWSWHRGVEISSHPATPHSRLRVTTGRVRSTLQQPCNLCCRAMVPPFQLTCRLLAIFILFPAFVSSQDT
jgi:hypothetical protein